MDPDTQEIIVQSSSDNAIGLKTDAPAIRVGAETDNEVILHVEQNVAQIAVRESTDVHLQGDGKIIEVTDRRSTGATGPSGPTGATGPAGKTGATGPRGIQGQQGISGPMGPTGPQGERGLRGYSGATGSIGFTGATGARGAMGYTGPKGDTGNTGSTGPTGLRGLTGPQGATGPAGRDGNPGAQGPTGARGEVGQVGYTGPTGPRGHAGATGATGPKGNPGTDGIDGQDGERGATGAMGITGPTGPRGATGPTGETGPAGDLGMTGATGPAGIDGIDGDDGLSAYQIWLSQGNTGTELDYIASLKGATGPTGETGPTGLTGGIGMTGATGPQGIPGAQGETGSQGSTGPTGPQGATGWTGPRGFTGEMGATGPQGIPGIDGAIGATGATGPAGADGTDGVDGNPGPAGPTGATGPQGLPGNDGIDGTQGATGATGPQGTPGNDGAQGIPGAAGATGATGPRGNPGNQGATGPAGLNGATGATGPQGNPGTTGATGPQGTQGWTGPAGTVGATGPRGFTGPAGPTGPQGNPGTAGATGATGPAGATGASNPNGVVGPAASTNNYLAAFSGAGGKTLKQIDVEFVEDEVNEVRRLVLRNKNTWNTAYLEMGTDGITLNAAQLVIDAPSMWIKTYQAGQTLMLSSSYIDIYGADGISLISVNGNITLQPESDELSPGTVIMAGKARYSSSEDLDSNVVDDADLAHKKYVDDSIAASPAPVFDGWTKMKYIDGNDFIFNVRKSPQSVIYWERTRIVRSTASDPDPSIVQIFKPGYKLKFREVGGSTWFYGVAMQSQYYPADEYLPESSSLEIFLPMNTAYRAHFNATWPGNLAAGTMSKNYEVWYSNYTPADFPLALSPGEALPPWQNQAHGAPSNQVDSWIDIWSLYYVVDSANPRAQPSVANPTQNVWYDALVDSTGTMADGLTVPNGIWDIDVQNFAMANWYSGAVVMQRASMYMGVFFQGATGNHIYGLGIHVEHDLRRDLSGWVGTTLSASRKALRIPYTIQLQIKVKHDQGAVPSQFLLSQHNKVPLYMQARCAYI